MKKLFFILPLVLLFSCSVQKRKYQKGFYVSAHKTKTTSKNEDAVVVKKQTPAKELVPIQTAIPIAEPLQAEASIDKKIFAVKTTVNPYLLFHNDGPCDVIVLKNGVEINAIVLEVSPIEVKYKKCDLPDSPMYIAEKADVFMIKYANGTKDVFKTEEKAKVSVTYSGSGLGGSNNTNTTAGSSKGKQTPDLAVLSIVLGIFGLFSIGSIPAIIAGNSALRKIEAQPNKYEGAELARTGKILGIIGLIIKIFLILMLILLIGSLSAI